MTAVSFAMTRAFPNIYDRSGIQKQQVDAAAIFVIFQKPADTRALKSCLTVAGMRALHLGKGDHEAAPGFMTWLIDLPDR